MSETTMRMRLAALAVALGLSTGAANGQELVIWHDKGEDGLRMVEQMAQAYHYSCGTSFGWEESGSPPYLDTCSAHQSGHQSRPSPEETRQRSKPLTKAQL